MGSGHEPEEEGWDAARPVAAGTQRHAGGRGWASIPFSGGLRAAVPGAILRSLACVRCAEPSAVCTACLTCLLLHHLGGVTGQRRPRQEPCSLVRHQELSPQLTVSLEVKRWAGLSGPVAVSLFISPGQKEGERVSSPVCLQGGHGGQMWEGTGGSFLLPPQRLVVQTGMIEPTFDNSFGPCPQGLWDR